MIQGEPSRWQGEKLFVGRWGVWAYCNTPVHTISVSPRQQPPEFLFQIFLE